MRQTLERYVHLYNNQLPQSALHSKTPSQTMNNWYLQKPELFHRKPPPNHPERDTYPRFRAFLCGALAAVASSIVALPPAHAAPEGLGLIWHNASKVKLHLGDGIGDYGHVRFVEKVTRLRPGIYIRPVFDTGEKRVSSLLGSHWRIPALESIAYPKDKDSYEVRMPDGGDLVFYRKKDGTYSAAKHRVWTATLSKDVFLVKSHYGVELTYKAGRLWKFRYPSTPHAIFHYEDGRIAEITYDGTTQLRAEYKKDKLVLKVKDRSNRVSEYEFPLVRVEEDGKWLTRMAGITIDGAPQKTFTYKNETRGTASMEIKAQPALIEQQWKLFQEAHPDDFADDIRELMPSLDHRFSWDTKTGYAKTHDHWVYTITPPEYAGGYAKIGRISTSEHYGKQYWHRDERAGKETTLRSDGFMLERSWFTSGALRWKEKSETSWIKGKLHSVTQSFYDENARLVRTHEERAGKINEVIYLYNKAGHAVAYVQNGKDLHEILPGGKALGEEFIKNFSGKTADIQSTINKVISK
jgi:hypothetical protein